MEFPDYLVLYDGHCGLCNGSVRFLLKIDRKAKLRFCALQSDMGRELTPHFRKEASSMETIVFMKKGEVYYFSSAILEILKTVGFPWSLFAIFQIIPVCFRNFLYKQIARIRYRIFGRRAQCKLLDPAYKERFLSKN